MTPDATLPGSSQIPWNPRALVTSLLRDSEAQTPSPPLFKEQGVRSLSARPRGTSRYGSRALLFPQTPQSRGTAPTPGERRDLSPTPVGARSAGPQPPPPGSRAHSHLLVFLLLGRETAGHRAELKVGAGQLVEEMHPGRRSVARGRPHGPRGRARGAGARVARVWVAERGAGGAGSGGAQGSGAGGGRGRGAEIGGRRGEARAGRAQCCPWRLRPGTAAPRVGPWHSFPPGTAPTYGPRRYPDILVPIGR